MGIIINLAYISTIGNVLPDDRNDSDLTAGNVAGVDDMKMINISESLLHTILFVIGKIMEEWEPIILDANQVHIYSNDKNPIIARLACYRLVELANQFNNVTGRILRVVESNLSPAYRHNRDNPFDKYYNPSYADWYGDNIITMDLFYTSTTDFTDVPITTLYNYSQSNLGQMHYIKQYFSLRIPALFNPKPIDHLSDLETLVKHKELFFFIKRFWSSPNEIPLKNIITIVLSKPSREDMILLCDLYGLETVQTVFDNMLSTEDYRRPIQSPQEIMGNGRLTEGSVNFINNILSKYRAK